MSAPPSSSGASSLLHSLLRRCRHTSPSLRIASLYCLTISVLFVGGLYAVPADVRALDRSDVRQIKWRMVSVLVTTLGATLLYTAAFCDDSADSWADEEEGGGPAPTTSALRYMGWDWRPSRDIMPLLHVAALYLGPIAAILAKVHVARTHRIVGDGRGAASSCVPRNPPNENVGYVRAFDEVLVRPARSFLVGSSDPTERWSKLRDLVVAPLSEEAVFRGCMVYPLLRSGLPPPAAAWAAPLFFGTAHLHHAATKLRQGMPPRHVALMTAFQFAYTALFGAYAAHALIRTGSVFAAALCHVFCNYMGVPDLGFLGERGTSLSCVYGHRRVICVAYAAGIVLFAAGFSSSRWRWWSFFPEGSVLPSL